MPHVTFIHGISNKPPPDQLLRIWRDGLATGDGVDLGAEGVTSSMVYWADVLYDEPVTAGANESVGNELGLGLESAGVVGAQASDVDMSWREKIGGKEKEWTDSLAAKLTFDPLFNDRAAPPEEEIDKPAPTVIGSGVAPVGAAATLKEAAAAAAAGDAGAAVVERRLERVPLPWFVKRRLMKEYLRDVHHYLFNEEFEPRPGASYRVRDEIRRRLLHALKEGAAAADGGKHVLVSHSMGTVIAYDVLKRVHDCPAIDGLMTIGSPLGLDEVQDKLRPEDRGHGWSRDDGFPHERLRGKWVNVFDRLDPVAGFDCFIANDYRRGGQKQVEDVEEPNWGKWRHNISNYLRGKKLRGWLGEMLDL